MKKSNLIGLEDKHRDRLCNCVTVAVDKNRPQNYRQLGQDEESPKTWRLSEVTDSSPLRIIAANSPSVESISS